MDRIKSAASAAYAWARAHRKAVLGAVAGVVGLVTALVPTFPGGAIVQAVTALLGA